VRTSAGGYESIFKGKAMSKPETIKIDDVEYVRKGTQPEMDEEYVIVRGDRSGVFAGYLAKRNGLEVTLHEARRLWYWDGAASISQIAMSGISKPENCKFPEPVAEIVILDAIEVIPVTRIAKQIIQGVKIWKE